jgi:hypothetical protein
LLSPMCMLGVQHGAAHDDHFAVSWNCAFLALCRCFAAFHQAWRLHDWSIKSDGLPSRQGRSVHTSSTLGGCNICCSGRSASGIQKVAFGTPKLTSAPPNIPDVPVTRSAAREQTVRIRDPGMAG